MNKSLLLLFLIVPLFQSCYEIGGKDYLASGVPSDPGSGTASLSSQVIEELKKSLSSLLSFRSSRDSNSRSSSFKLNSDDIDHLLAGAEKAIIESNLTDSEDLTLVLQKIAEGAQTSIIGITPIADKDNRTMSLIGVIGGSMIKSINGRTQYLNATSAKTNPSPRRVESCSTSQRSKYQTNSKT